jgi:hypothetical protein
MKRINAGPSDETPTRPRLTLVEGGREQKDATPTLTSLQTKLYGTPSRPSGFIARLMKAHALTFAEAVKASRAAGR